MKPIMRNFILQFRLPSSSIAYSLFEKVGRSGISRLPQVEKVFDADARDHNVELARGGMR